MNYIALWYTSIVLTFASVGEVFGQELANNLSESTDTKGNKRKQAVILPEQTLTKHYSDYEVRAQLGLFHLSDEYVKSLLDKLILHLQQIKPGDRLYQRYLRSQQAYAQHAEHLPLSTVAQRLSLIRGYISQRLPDFVTLSYEDQIYLVLHPLWPLLTGRQPSFQDGSRLDIKLPLSSVTRTQMCRSFDQYYLRQGGYQSSKGFLYPEYIHSFDTNARPDLSEYLKQVSVLSSETDILVEQKKLLIAYFFDQYERVFSTTPVAETNEHKDKYHIDRLSLEQVINIDLQRSIILKQAPRIDDSMLDILQIDIPHGQVLTESQADHISRQRVSRAKQYLQDHQPLFVGKGIHDILYDLRCQYLGIKADAKRYPIMSFAGDIDSDSQIFYGASIPAHADIDKTYQSQYDQYREMYGAGYTQVLHSIHQILMIISCRQNVAYIDSLKTDLPMLQDLGVLYQHNKPGKIGLLGVGYEDILSEYPTLSIGQVEHSPHYAFRTELQVLHRLLTQLMSQHQGEISHEHWTQWFQTIWSEFPFLLNQQSKKIPHFISKVAATRTTEQLSKFGQTDWSSLQAKILQQSQRRPISSTPEPAVSLLDKNLSTIPSGASKLLPSVQFPGSYFGNTEYIQLLMSIDQSFGLPQGTLACFLAIESGGRPYQTSMMGAQGLFQFMPSTIPVYINKLNTQGYRIQGRQLSTQDVYHPIVSALMAAEYLREFGMQGSQFDMSRAIIAYNAGSAWIGATNIPAETQVFIRKYQELQTVIQGKTILQNNYEMEKFGLRIRSIITATSTPTIHNPGYLSIHLLKDAQTLISGDSNAEAIEKHLKKSQSSGWTKAGRRTDQLYQYFQHNLGNLKQAERLVIYCGVNDMMGVLSPEAEAKQTISQFQKIIDLVHTKYPNMQIIICEYHNVVGSRAAFVESLNQQLREAGKSAARQDKNVSVIDPSKPLSTRSYSPRDNHNNLVHPANPADLINKLPEK